LRKTILIGAVLAGCFAALAADNLKPFDVKLGLWETTSTSQTTGTPPRMTPDQLAKIPPDQRPLLEMEMRAQSVPPPPRTATSKLCVTQDFLDRSMAFSAIDNACTPKVISSSSSKREMHLDCRRPSGRSAGDVTFERVDSQHIKGAGVMKSLQGGRETTIKMSFTSKWVASSCADLKSTK
jgi:hypothetical protein